MNRCYANFVEKYFSRALTAFLKSQREFDHYLRQTLGLYSAPLMGRGWAEMMLAPFMQAFPNNNGETVAAEEPAAESPPVEEADLRQAVRRLEAAIGCASKGIAAALIFGFGV